MNETPEEKAILDKWLEERLAEIDRYPESIGPNEVSGKGLFKRRAIEARETEFWRVLGEIEQAKKREHQRLMRNAPVYLGDGWVRLHGQEDPIHLSPTQQKTLEALLEGPKTTKQLVDARACSNANMTIASLAKDLGTDYFVMPGKSKKGQGYYTRVKDGREQAGQLPPQEPSPWKAKRWRPGEWDI